MHNIALDLLQQQLLTDQIRRSRRNRRGNDPDELITALVMIAVAAGIYYFLFYF